MALETANIPLPLTSDTGKELEKALNVTREELNRTLDDLTNGNPSPADAQATWNTCKEQEASLIAVMDHLLAAPQFKNVVDAIKGFEYAISDRSGAFRITILEEVRKRAQQLGQTARDPVAVDLLDLYLKYKLQSIDAVVEYPNAPAADLESTRTQEFARLGSFLNDIKGDVSLSALVQAISCVLLLSDIRSQARTRKEDLDLDV